MTHIYETPKVLHIQETDKDGNKMIVRYYREDTVNRFEDVIFRELHKIKEEADSYREEQ